MTQTPRQLPRRSLQGEPSPLEMPGRFVERRLLPWFDRWLVREPSRTRQATSCMAVCIAILGLRYLLEDWLRGGLPFVLLTPMVTFCALRMGWPGGVLAVASALLYSMVEPHVSGRYGSLAVVEGLFALSSALNIFVCSRCRVALLEVERQRTELKTRSRTQVELALKSASLGGLTASMRHEVNQPLAAAKTYAQAGTRWLSRDPPDIAECRAALLRIVEAADQANGILKRLGGGGADEPIARAPVVLMDIVAEAVSVVRPRAEAGGVALTLAPDACAGTVLGDRVMLQQVFSNLLANGVQACAGRREGPRGVHVSCRREPGTVLVSVEDTGSGFPDEDPEQSFAAFYSTKADGMGLGLPISRMTIEAHGGVLTVGNRPGGAGAFALVRLPTA